MKRYAVLLVLGAVGGLMVGCGPREEEAQTAEAPAVEETTAAPMEHATPSHDPAAAGARAVAQLQPADPASGVSGTVTLSQEATGVRVVAEVSGLAAGKHGFHIHENGECTPPFESAGEHLNPHNYPHGCAPADQRHLGDIGNLEVGADGIGRYDQVIDKISLVDPGHQVAGRSIVIHHMEDDCQTQPTGGSAGRVACGVIQLEGHQEAPAQQ